MGSTIDDVADEIYFEEERKREKKEALEILEKIANSENIHKLQKNLDELKNTYISDLSIDDDSVDKLISELDFSMPKLKEYFEKSEKSEKSHFFIGVIIALVAIIIGLIL